MKEIIKRLLKGTVLYYPLRNCLHRRRGVKELVAWEKGGRAALPPHLYKQILLKKYAEQFKLEELVETGTCCGDMVEAMKGSFSKIYSIELSPYFYNEARNRFKNSANIELLHGDSSNELGNLIKRIDKPALFWLDGHYSGGLTARGECITPIFAELEYIFSSLIRGHVILIDDANCFHSDPGYPRFEELKSFVQSKKPDLMFRVEDNIIRILPD
jgi:hypothetical protein